MNSETRNTSTSSVRACQNCKQDFTIEPQDFDFYKKMAVPAPTWCPQCRLQRRLAFMNERALYKRNCDLCGKSIVTMYAPDTKYVVYCNPCWWSDKWDGTQYARAYDPSRPFLEQLKQLSEKTPQMALEVNYPTLVNSEYVNHAATAKNCYLIFTADECENVLYSEILMRDKDSMDCSIMNYSELCYESIDCHRSSKTFFSEDCVDCVDVYFSKNCRSCANCFGCTNLRGKQYHIFNQPYSKEEYRKKLEEMKLDSRISLEAHKKRAREFWLTTPRRFMQSGSKSVNVTGDYTYWSKNAHDMHLVVGAEDSRYCQILTMLPTRDAYDYTIWGNNAERIYEAMIVGEGADTVKFSYQCWPNVQDVAYSLFTISSKHIFGCANIRNKQYCILNKQYSEGDFEKLREKITQDMIVNPYVDSIGRKYPYGEFLPPELSPFGYNESYAMNFFPLSEAEAEKNGFGWYVPKPNPHKSTLLGKDLPDTIREVNDSILQEIIECEGCKTPFRIVPSELGLLRRFTMPLPSRCPACRSKARFLRINPPRLYERTCQCAGTASENRTYTNISVHPHGPAHCSKLFQTSYAPDRPEIVYCETCYQSEVV
jgi:hypothetical protein